MKTLKTPLLLVFLFILFSAASCKKEQPDPPPDLPPLTTTGAMTFGCYVNGEPWVAQVPPFLPTEVHLAGNLYLTDSILAISATRFTDSFPRETIVLQINDFDMKEGNYINSITKCYANYSYRCTSGIANNDFNLMIDSTNFINISFMNIDKRIVSGTFSIIVNAERCPEEIIHIEQGRFDILVGIIE